MDKPGGVKGCFPPDETATPRQWESPRKDTMKRTALSVIAVMILLLVSSVRAADISGTWKASFDTQIGVQNYTYDFKVIGNQLTGKAKSDNGESELKNGKIEGDKVSFVESLTVMGMTIEVTYSGTVTSNDEIKFTRDVGGFATEELVAKRAK